MKLTMTTTSLSLIFIFTFASISAGILTAPNPKMAFLGSFEGKGFYAHKDNTMDWESARTFCQSEGMALASIEKAGEWDLLQDAFHEITFSGLFWTAARDSSKPTQFSWDNTDADIGSDVVVWDLLPSFVQTCVFYMASSGTPYLRQISCSSAIFTLCQMNEN